MNEYLDKITLFAHFKTHKYYYLLLAFVILVNIRILTDLVADWLRDDNYSHGFLIIPISIYLIFRERKGLKFNNNPGKIGMIPLVVGCIGIIAGTAAGEYFTTRVSLILIITGITIYHMGRESFGRVWFAFFFLLFMVPIPAVIYYSIAFPMQLMATKITVILLSFIGVPAIGTGNIIHLPNYTLEVAEACSGLRSLTALLALTGLYAYLTLKGKFRQTLLFILAIPIALAANIVRLLITSIGAYAVSTRIAEDFLHELSGLFVFGSALILTVFTGALLRWRSNRS